MFSYVNALKGGVFIGGEGGIRKAGRSEAKVTKCPVDTSLGRGRIRKYRDTPGKLLSALAHEHIPTALVKPISPDALPPQMKEAYEAFLSA